MCHYISHLNTFSHLNKFSHLNTCSHLNTFYHLNTNSHLNTLSYLNTFSHLNTDSHLKTLLPQRNLISFQFLNALYFVYSFHYIMKRIKIVSEVHRLLIQAQDHFIVISERRKIDSYLHNRQSTVYTRCIPFVINQRLRFPMQQDAVEFVICL